jgi:hypothetical protein
MNLNLKGTLLVTLLLLPAVSFGGNLKMVVDGPSTADVNSVRNKADDLLGALKGVNGSGITACETKTGLPFTQLSQAEIAASEFENCLSLSTTTRRAKSALDALLPIGTRVAGVYVTTQHVGIIRPQ